MPNCPTVRIPNAVLWWTLVCTVLLGNTGAYAGTPPSAEPLTHRNLSPNQPPSEVWQASDLMEMAQNYLETQAQAEGEGLIPEVLPVDDQVRVPVCRMPPQLQLAGGGSNTHLLSARVTQIHCTDPEWKLLLPYRLQRLETVAVAKRPLPMHTSIRAEDWEYKTIDTIKKPYLKPIRDLHEVLGFVLKKPMHAGEMLSEQATQAPLWVRRQQKTVIETRSPGLQVTAEGVALSDGRAGDWIRVKNTQSQRTIEGRVIASGRVSVDP